MILIVTTVLVYVQAISSLRLLVSPEEVSQSATYTIEFITDVLAETSFTMEVTFPSPIVVLNTVSCVVTVTGAEIPSAVCSRLSNVVTITGAFLSSGSIHPVNLAFSNVLNPPSSTETAPVEIVIMDGSTEIEGETNGALMTFSATPATMLSSSIAPLSDVIGASTSWTVKFEPKNAVPANTIVEITFPYWNGHLDPPDSSRQHYFQGSQPVCTMTHEQGTLNPTCNYDSDTLKLRASDGFFLTVTGEIELIFTNVQNPPSPGTISGFEIKLLDASNGELEEISATVAVSTANVLTSVASSVDPTEVSNIGLYTLQFTVTNVLYTGCYIQIEVPSEIVFDGTVSATGAFGISASLTTSISGSVITLQDGFTSYSTSNSVYVNLTPMTNPGSTQPTGTFSITTRAPSSAIIDIGSGGVITATPGTINQYLTNDFVLSNQYVIGNSATYTFDFATNHTIEAGGFVTVEFPPEIAITARSDTTACTSIGAGLFQGATCEVVGQVLTIHGGFSTAFPSGRINFSIDGVTNSLSTAPSSSFKIVTHPTDISYKIDELTTGITITALTAALRQATITPQSVITGAQSVYEFLIETTTIIPANGYLLIQVPSEVTIIDTAQAQSSCTRLEGFPSDPISCTVTSNSIRVSGFSSSFSSGVLRFSVDFFQNPPSTKPSSSFVITSYNSGDFEIDSLSSGVTVRATTANELQSATITPSALVNGQQSDYTVQLTVQNETPSPVIVKVTPPATVGFPAFPTCTHAVGITCSSVDSSSVQAQITLSSTLNSGGTIEFVIQSVTNPSTTQPTDTFQVFTFTNQDYAIDKKETGITIATTTPATLTDIIISAQDSKIATATTYIISYVPVNPHPIGTTLKIVVPAELTLGVVSCSSPVLDAGLVCSTSGNTITATGGFAAEIASPFKVEISIGGITNPTTQTATSLWKVDSEIGVYLIDTNNALTSSFTCTSPCLTCTTLPTTCTSCDTNSAYPYFYSNTCNAACPVGEVDVSTVCTPCQAPCTECVDTVTKCTNCDPSSANPYLYGDTCNASCPAGQYGENINCINCPNPCLECTDASTCTSCTTRTSIPDLGAQTYLLAANCVVECGDGYIENTTTFSCDACTGDCATCENTTSYCLSCTDPAKFAQEGACVNSCPTDNTYLQIGQECIKCHSPCATCTIDLNSCLTCQTGIIYGYACVTSCPSTLFEVSGQCVSCESPCDTCLTGTTDCATCDRSTQPYLLQGNQCVLTCDSAYYSDGNNCVQCDSNCLQCEGSATNCTQCQGGKFLEAGTCVDSCTPDLYALVGAECTPCTAPCVTCSTSPTTCKSCATGMKLYNDNCISQCPTGTTIDSGLTCDDCVAPCATCETTTSNCLTCATDLLKAGTCVSSCAPDYVLFDGICIPCDSNCVECDTTSTNCTVCNSSEFLLNGVCYSSCPDNYSPSGSNCVADTYTECNPGCTEEFLQNDTCETACQVSACLDDNGKCVVGTTVCADGQWLNGSVCEACSSPCDQCSTSATACTTCELTAAGRLKLLYNNSCYETCPTKTYKSSSLLCSDCDADCATCQGTSSTCTSCQDSSHFLFNNTCVTSCPSGSTVPSGSVCLDCNSNCLTCQNNTTECATCESSVVLQSGTCKAQCDSGFTIVTSSGTNECQACTSCLTCTETTTKCTSCSALTFLHNEECLSTCPLGTYSSVDRCISCPSQCAECSNADTCTVCSGGHVKFNNTCLSACPSGYEDSSGTCTLIPDTECAAGCTADLVGNSECNAVCAVSACNNDNNQCDNPGTCPAGFYFDGSNCQVCTGDCLTCTGASVCTACREDSSTNTLKYLYNNQCYTTCPSKTLRNLVVCLDCDADCAECSGTVDYCTQCVTGKSHNGECKSSCPAGTTVENGDFCEDCGDECNTCSGNTHSCTSCKNGEKLQGDKCQAACDDGYTTTSSDTETCVACTDNCATCSGETNSCNSCQASFLFHNNSCVSTCPANTSVQISTECLDCQSPCLECTQVPTQCTVCTGSTYLYENQCLSSCPSGYEAVSGACQILCAENCSLVDLNNSVCDLACNTISCARDNGFCTADSDCEMGQYFDTTTMTCVSCTGDCSTCTAANFCTGCKTSGSTQPLLYNGVCYSTCPASTFRNGVICEDCSSDCGNCENSSTNCTSCDSPDKLHNNSCVVSCPTNTTVEISEVCHDCESPCSECSGTVSTCTSCPTGTNLDDGTCVAVCPEGETVTTASPTTCVACTDDCTACIGETNRCTKCTGKLLHNNTCIDACPEGFAETTEVPGVCTPCSSACKDCETSVDNCTDCETGQYVTSSNTCQANVVCPTGMSTTPTSNGVCLTCTSPCVTCDTDITSCTSCISGMILDGSSCVPCTSPCVTCEFFATRCLSCIEGYYLSSNTCNQCDSSCQNCAGSATSCTSCDTGYLLSSNACLQCSSECLTCYPDTGTCTSCGPNLFLESGSCVSCSPTCLTCSNSSTTCATCADGTYLTSSFTCNSCVGCAKCENNAEDCTECAAGEILINKRCGVCDSSCATCEGSFTTCATCAAGEVLVQGKCGVCNSNCATCTSDFSSCATCAAGMYLVGGACVSCDSNCLTCEGSPTRCTSCISTMFLVNNACVGCDANCLTCEGSPSTCTSCEIGKSLIISACDTCNAVCKVCSGHVDFCTECFDGDYLKGSTCLTCDSNCATCEDTASNCLTCPAGSSLVQGYCERDCSDGKFLYQGSCLPCDTSCVTCFQSADNCTSCTSGPIHNGECVGICPVGYYEAGLYCEACSSLCADCETTASTCTACSSDKTLSNNICIAICESGQYFDGNNCQLCSSNCNTCSLQPTLCTSCKNADEVITASNVCEVPCEEGFTRTSSSGDLCVACADQCRTCETSIDKCTECKYVGYRLYNNLCLLECPVGTTIDFITSCVDCDSDCLTCSSTPTTCTSCSSDQVLFAGSCLSRCPLGYYQVGGECSACEGGCPDPVEPEEPAEEFDAGTVPFPFSGAVTVSTGVAAVAASVAGVSAMPALTAVSGLQAVASWGFVAGYVPYEEGYGRDVRELGEIEGRNLYIVDGSAGNFVLETAFIAIFTACLTQILLNILFICVYSSTVASDLLFVKWKRMHGCGLFIILLLSFIFTYNLVRLLVCGLFNLKLFSAEFRDKTKLLKPLLKLGYITVFCSCVPMLMAQTILLLHYPISNSTFMLCVDSMVITLIFTLLLIVSLIQMEKECMRIDCLVQTGLPDYGYVKLERGTISDTIIDFPHYDFKNIFPLEYEMIKPKPVKKFISRTPPPSRSTSPVNVRRKNSFPLDGVEDIIVDRNLFSQADYDPNIIESEEEMILRKGKSLESTVMEIPNYGHMAVKKRVYKPPQLKATGPQSTPLEMSQSCAAEEVRMETEHERRYILDESDLDLRRAIPDPRDPEVINVYDRVIGKRLKIRKEFAGATLVDHPGEVVNPQEFYLFSTIVDDDDVRMATMIAKNGRKVRVRRKFVNAEIIDKVEDKDEIIGAIITSDDELQLDSAKIDLTDPEAILVVHKPTGAVVTVRKSFHGSRVVDFFGKFIDGVPSVDLSSYDVRRTQVNADDVRLATLFHKYTSAKVRVRRSFEGARVINNN